MIISFTVENFKSFKDKVTFTTEASVAYKEHINTLIHFRNKNYNRINAIFGSNASGKSNFILALLFLRNFVVESNRIMPNQKILVTPFKFDNKNAYSFFEIVFVVNEIKYVYGLRCNETVVLEEYLSYSPNGRMISIFKRINTNEYEFGTDDTFLKDIVSKTSENRSFLTSIVSWNYEKAKPVLEFFYNMDILFIDQKLFYSKTQNRVFEKINSDEKYKEFLIKILLSADINIVDITVEKENSFVINFPLQNGQVDHYKVLLYHEINGKKYAISLGEESLGTQALVQLSYIIYNSLENEKVVIIDEIDSSLHPLLVMMIVNLYKENNISSQLIFNSHDINLLDLDLLRRDQIFFFEKDKNCSSYLYNLKDFGVRITDKVARDYLYGRYGAVPNIKDIII